MNNVSTALAPSPAAAYPARQAVAPREAEPNPLRLVHGLLRGRYALTAALAVLLAAGGAGVAYKVVPPEYESRSQIRFAPVLPKVLYESEENQMMPMFEAFIQTQASVIQSRRVIEMAMQSPVYREGGGGYSQEAVGEFAKELKVDHPKNSQIIEVRFKNLDPAMARAAVKSVVDSYISIYGETDLRTETQRLGLLEERYKALTGQIEAIRSQVLDIANEFGSEALEGMYTFKVQELQKVESELKAAKLAMLSAEPPATEPAEDGSPQASPVEVTEDEVAVFDPYMRRLVEERNRARVEMEVKGVQVGPRHRSYIAAEDRLRSFQGAVDRQLEKFRGSPDATAGPASGSVAFQAPSGVGLRNLKATVEQLQAAYDQAKAESLDLGRKNLQIQKLRTDMAALQERLDTTNSRIEELNIESAVGGRISVVSEAEQPIGASNSRRRVQVTVLGGLGGFGLGVGLVMLTGLVNPRIRDCVDAGGARLTLLGVVPGLPSDLSDPVSAAVAAHCVHQLRVMIQIQMQQQSARVFAVTSADSGTGKTSISLSLGLSLAASGVRTLIVDGDSVGMGLTRRTEAIARRKIGQVLLREGLIDENRLDQGLLLASQSGMCLGRALIELGYVTQPDLDRSLARQKEMRLGLSDAIQGAGMDDCIAQIGVPNLYVLPAGRHIPGQTMAISPASLDRLLKEMRANYDAVVIDTGPVPGSTDASIMTAGADRVIVVASRGDSHAQVRHTLQHLESMRAPVMGLVFNRARNWDLARSGQFSSAVSGSSGFSVDHDPASRQAHARRLEEFVRYGPLPQAVVADTRDLADKARSAAITDA